MTIAALLVAAVSIASLYDTAFKQHRLRLTDAVKTQAGFIEVIVRIANPEKFNSLESGFEISNIEQLIKSQIQLEGFGNSGEFNLFRMQDNTIEFVISQGIDATEKPRPIPFAGKWAEAMKLALSGKSGTLIGPDYRGHQVLAAFEPVPIVGMGLVAKIDMSEIRAPFIKAGLLALGLAILVILIAASIFWRLSQSVVRQLAQQAETFKTLVDTAREGIILIDENSSIQFVNPAAETLFGYSQGELKGTNISRLTPSPHREAHDQYVKNYLDTGVGKIIGTGRKLSGVRKDGSLFPMHLSIGDINLEHTRLFAGVIMDLSEQQQLQREIMELPVREQRRIGQELHDDLGQQLTGLSMIATSLLNKASRNEHELAKQLTQGITKALSQVRDISRGLMPAEIGVNELESALVNLCDRVEQQSGIAIKVDINSQLRAPDDIAAMHLYRLCQEALNNAVKHANANQISVELAIGGDHGLLQVSDDGDGVAPPNDLPSGLGMRIMKFRSELFNSEFTIDSSADSGTRVCCRFPLPRLDQD